MDFRGKLKQLYNEKLPGHGEKAKFDFAHEFGINGRTFRAMFDGRDVPIRHDVAERVIEKWVPKDERDLVRGLAGYPQKPHYIQADVDACLKDATQPLGDLVRAICDYYEITQSNLRAACKARGTDVVVVGLLDRNQMLNAEQGAALLSAVADLSGQPDAATLPGLCDLGLRCQQVLQMRKQHFGDVLGAFRQVLTGDAQHPCEWKHICGGIDTGYNTLIDFERSKKMPETNLVDQVIGFFASNTMRALDMPYADKPPMEREIAFYEDAQSRYAQNHWLRRPERWAASASTQKFAERLRAVRMELDNGAPEKDNPGSQKSIGIAVGYPAETATTSLGNIERAKGDMPATRKLRLFHHLGCANEEEFAQLADKIVAVRAFRDERFGAAIHEAIGRLKDEGETRKAFCERHDLEAEYTRTFAYDSHERGSWLIRKIVGSISPCGMAGEADVYTVAGMDCPHEKIQEVEAFVQSFMQQHHFITTDAGRPGNVQGAYETSFSRSS